MPIHDGDAGNILAGLIFGPEALHHRCSRPLDTTTTVTSGRADRCPVDISGGARPDLKSGTCITVTMAWAHFNLFEGLILNSTFLSATARQSQ